jgi:ketosteroid isomerase-like protein
MDALPEEAIRAIKRIHSSWLEYEIAGDGPSLMELCSDDIELWPPHGRPWLGRAAVSAQMMGATARIHGIEIADLRIRGANQLAYLTANYRTTFSSAENDIPRQAVGSHLWILRNQVGTWLVTLVSWRS